MKGVIYRLATEAARRIAAQAVMHSPDNHEIEIREPKRTTAQNAAQWPILQAFADQLLWPVNGEKVRMTPDEFKDVLSSAFFQETVRLAAGINGGVVMLGKRTSKFDKPKFSEWLEFLHAVAAQRGVNLSRNGKEEICDAEFSRV